MLYWGFLSLPPIFCCNIRLLKTCHYFENAYKKVKKKKKKMSFYAPSSGEKKKIHLRTCSLWYWIYSDILYVISNYEKKKKTSHV